LIEHGLTSH